MKNLGTMDRLLRVILAELCILVAFFWVAEEWQIPLYLIAAVMLFQAVTATCGIYRILGWNSCEVVKRRDKNMMTVFVIVALLLAGAGSYGSFVITRNTFLSDAESVNASYSITMQSLGEGNRENALNQYGKLESTFANFSKKYSKYKPLTVKFDGNFTGEMNNVSSAISGSGEDIRLGDLVRGREKLMKAGPEIRKIMDR